MVQNHITYQTAEGDDGTTKKIIIDDHLTTRTPQITSEQRGQDPTPFGVDHSTMGVDQQGIGMPAVKEFIDFVTCDFYRLASSNGHTPGGAFFKTLILPDEGHTRIDATGAGGPGPNGQGTGVAHAVEDVYDYSYTYEYRNGSLCGDHKSRERLAFDVSNRPSNANDLYFVNFARVSPIEYYTGYNKYE